jgi:hypothetical protein
MTTHIHEELLQVTATEDLSAATARYKAVTFAGTIAADAKRPAGLLKFGATSGSIVSVILEGLTKGDVSGTVTTIGWPLKITTSGWLTAAASGDRVAITLDCKMPSVWHGQ